MRRLPFANLCCSVFTLVSLPVHALQIPLEPGPWQILGYRGIPVNEVDFSGDDMEIGVNGSAGAIVYPLKVVGRYGRLHVDAVIHGRVDLGSNVQGGKGGDDFRLRVGLVYAGDKTLNFFQRTVAPKWIRTLYALAPKGSGISRVEFYNTWQDPVLEGRVRPHPTTDIWREHFVLETDSAGRVNQTLAIPTDADIVAVWISSDGDDTGSSYNVRIHSLSLDHG